MLCAKGQSFAHIKAVFVSSLLSKNHLASKTEIISHVVGASPVYCLVIMCARAHYTNSLVLPIIHGSRLAAPRLF